ncbi:MAG TPA: TadE family protein [Actinomycetota bacterium]|nr:TadE family protein [Actinomycetota bacterium]
MRDQRGTAALEFALVLPIVLAIVLALVQVGLLVRDRLLVESAVRSGARTAAVEPGDEAVRAAVVRSAPSLEPGSLSVSTVRAGVRGEPVTVTVSYVAPISVPFVAWLFPAGVTMRAEATDRQEFT